MCPRPARRHSLTQRPGWAPTRSVAAGQLLGVQADAVRQLGLAELRRVLEACLDARGRLDGAVEGLHGRADLGVRGNLDTVDHATVQLGERLPGGVVDRQELRDLPGLLAREEPGVGRPDGLADTRLHVVDVDDAGVVVRQHVDALLVQRALAGLVGRRDAVGDEELGL